ncbi:flavodoxin [Ruminococcus sp. FC2018]|uniref:flavodoxin n=1 Tax=Ruminococcus sp. FC2018 TaxID=1410617 RepID=UPI000A62D350|nr:flavodoxin [Ruminococcus sp. FC2018]
MKIKKMLFTVIAASMLMLTACGSSSSTAESSKSAASEVSGSSAAETDKTETQAAESAAPETSVSDSSKTPESNTDNSSSSKDTIVVYFSATGTTKGVAEKIAEVTGGDIYEIVPQEKYTAEDLNWHDDKSRTTIEMNDTGARPKINGELPDLSGYKTVYIGYPIWWGDAPRIMSTFVESVKLDGKTVIPFCTSGSSPIGNSGKNLEKQAGQGSWLSGGRLDGGISKEKLTEWIDGIK